MSPGQPIVHDNRSHGVDAAVYRAHRGGEQPGQNQPQQADPGQLRGHEIGQDLVLLRDLGAGHRQAKATGLTVEGEQRRADYQKQKADQRVDDGAEEHHATSPGQAAGAHIALNHILRDGIAGQIHEQAKRGGREDGIRAREVLLRKHRVVEVEHLKLVVRPGDRLERRPASLDATDGQEHDNDNRRAKHRRLQDVGPDYRLQAAHDGIDRGKGPDADQHPEVLGLAKAHDRLQRQCHRIKHRAHPAQGVHTIESRSDTPGRQAESSAQILVATADLEPHEHRHEYPPENGGNHEGNEQNRQIETEVLVGPALGKSQEGDRAETGGEHRHPDGEPVHGPAADEIVLVVPLAPGALESQAKDHGQIANAHEPVD